MVNIEKLSGIGTEWNIDIFDADTAETEVLRERIDLEIQNFEAAFSRFKADSLVSILNRTGTLEHPSPELLALLKLGKQLYTRSQGYFNFLTGGIQVARGYDAAYSFTEQATPPETLPNAHTDLLLSPERITLNAGQVDVGGYGKGVLIDTLAKELRNWGYEYFVINGGGDIYVTSNEGSPVTVMVAHPFIPHHYTHRLELIDSALGVSSPAGRQWQTKNSHHTYSHIIATQSIQERPQFGAAVIASSATDADAFATVLTTIGADIPTVQSICPPPAFAWLLVHQDNRAFSSQNWPGTPLTDVEKT